MVVDTSVIVDALVAGPLSGAARAVLAIVQGRTSPDLVAVETGAALTEAVRRRAIEPAYARMAYRSLRRLVPVIEPAGPFLGRALDLSLELDHPFADCVFLAHAEARADVLITSDAHFVRKVAASPHARSVVELSHWRP